MKAPKGKTVDSQIANRKIEHLRTIGNDPAVDRHASGFDKLALTHRALPQLDYAKVDTRVSFLGKELRFPLLISSMTGGTGSEIMQINKNLAAAAEETGVAMSVGSQRVMFSDPAARGSFSLRDVAPTVPLIGNIGAVQLNKGIGIIECEQAIDVLGADGLYFHLNPLQEAIQPEGDVDFSNLASKIGDIAGRLSVPCLIKEVGSGLSVADIELALAAGIRHFDVAGRGGTSWSRIEYHRRTDDADDLGLLFQDWGLTTVDALRLANTHLNTTAHETTLIASGGIRNGIDMAKSVILGAKVCGVAGPLLKAAQTSSDDVVAAICKLQTQFKTAMFLLGCSRVEELRNNTSLLHTGDGLN